LGPTVFTKCVEVGNEIIADDNRFQRTEGTRSALPVPQEIKSSSMSRHRQEQTIRKRRRRLQPLQAHRDPEAVEDATGRAQQSNIPLIGPTGTGERWRRRWAVVVRPVHIVDATTLTEAGRRRGRQNIIPGCCRPPTATSRGAVGSSS
jgi:ATP-dependent protease Clp ATPase subunit